MCIDLFLKLYSLNTNFLVQKYINLPKFLDAASYYKIIVPYYSCHIYYYYLELSSISVSMIKPGIILIFKDPDDGFLFKVKAEIATNDYKYALTLSILKKALELLFCVFSSSF